MQPERENSALSETRLARLMAALGELVGGEVDDPTLTIGDLGIGSQHIVELLIACEDIYEATLDGGALDLGYESSVLSVHRQLSNASP